MKNTSSPQIVVNLTDAGVRCGGAGAYAAFCAQVAVEEFGAVVVRTPGWVRLLPLPLASAVRFEFSRRRLRRYPGIVYNPTYRAVPGHPSQVITVFDLIPLRHCVRNPLQRRYFADVLPSAVRSALRVITLSETTRQEVLQFYDLPSERIAVVPPGVDTSRFSPGPGRFVGEPYLLAVGASLPHKNIHELLARWQLWAGRYRLIVTGADHAYRRRLLLQARMLGISDRVSLLGVTNSRTLVELYRGCTALVYPSLEEGFGLPPLEAFACGRPAIVSDIPVHREVCGEAAVYVRPGDAASWQAALERIADPAETARRLRAGGERVRRYSLEETRQRLIETLRELVP